MPTKSKSYPWLRPLAIVIIIILLSGVAILVLSTPSERLVYLEVTTSYFRSPTEITLSLPEADPIWLTGFDARFASFTHLDITADGNAIQSPPAAVLSLTRFDPSRKFPSRVILSHVHTTGFPASARLPAGTMFRTDFNFYHGKCDLSIFTPDSGATVKLWQKDIVIPQSENLRITPPPKSVIATQSTNYRLQFANDQGGLVQADFSVPTNKQSDFPPTIWFLCPENTKAKCFEFEKFIIPTDKHMNIFDASVGKVNMHGVKAPDILRNVESSLDLVGGKSFELSRLELMPPDSEGKCHLLLMGKGILSSFRQDSNELLPTKLTELINGSPAEKGILGSLGLFLIFAGGIFLKESLEDLAEWALGDHAEKDYQGLGGKDGQNHSNKDKGGADEILTPTVSADRVGESDAHLPPP